MVREAPSQKGYAKSTGLLTIRDVANFLNVHINTVRRWSRKGILKSYRISRRGDLRFRQEDIDAFLMKGKIE
jgi:excisionase family DNA binding protein